VNVGGTINVRATIVNQTKNKTAPVIVELGVPAGYFAYYDDLAQSSSYVRGVQIVDGKATINLDGMDAGQKIDLNYRVIANIPGSVRIPRSRVYQAISSGDAVEEGTGEVLVSK
jgi:hypothetical protein